MVRAAGYRLDSLRQGLDHCRSLLETRSPDREVQAFRQRLDDLQTSMAQRLLGRADADRVALDTSRRSMEYSIRTQLQERVHRLQVLREGIHVRHPQETLARGYARVSVTRLGGAIRRASDARRGDRLDIRLHSGSLSADVLEVRDDERKP